MPPKGLSRLEERGYAQVCSASQQASEEQLGQGRHGKGKNLVPRGWLLDLSGRDWRGIGGGGLESGSWK